MPSLFYSLSLEKVLTLQVLPNFPETSVARLFFFTLLLTPPLLGSQFSSFLFFFFWQLELFFGKRYHQQNAAGLQ